MNSDTSKDSEQEQQKVFPSFHQFLAQSERKRVLVTLTFALFGYPVFGILDYVVYPEYARMFIAIRLLLSAVVLAGLALLYLFGHTYYIITAISCPLTTLVALTVVFMTHMTGGLSSPYYAGISLVVVVAAVVFVWPLWVSAISYSLILLAYYIPILLSGNSIDAHYMWNNSFFLGMTVVVSMLGSYLRNRLAFNEYTQRKALVNFNKQLEELHAFKDQMFQNVSHEFRTPLTLMLAPVEMMLDEIHKDSYKHQHLHTVRRHSLRLLNLINDLLDLAKLGKQSLVNNAVPLNIVELIKKITEDAQVMAQNKSVNLKLELKKENLVYLLDPRHIEKIILNLLSNALKFTPSEGTITIWVDEDKRGLVVEIRDTGIGIPQEALTRIFERFQQVDGTTTRKFGGTGIGLSLVWELVHLMGGVIEVESKPEQGSCFRLLFGKEIKSNQESVKIEMDVGGLVALSRSAAFTALEQASDSFGKREAGDSGPFILVAEDNSELNQQLVNILSEDYTVVSFPNGLDAYEYALKNKPDIILSDVMMPKMDGLELSKKLRERSDFKEVPIILLSAHSDLEARISGRQAGVDTYLTKPFHHRELLATIDGLLRSRMRLVGSYMLYDQLGEGGQSKVFLGRHIKSDAIAAVKIISPEGSDEQIARKLIRKEQELLAKITHTNIVSVLEHGNHEDQYYMVMEYLHGLSLEELVEYNGNLSVGSVATIGAVIADALSVVHAQGIVHRDIKCSNIMLVEGPQTLKEKIRVIDFGTAFEGKDMQEIKDDKVIGTLPLLAPELILGGTPSIKSDIYALGVSLYYMITGKYPFVGDSVMQLAKNIHAQETPHVAKTNNLIPKQIDAVIYKCMEKDESKRFSEISDIQNALKKYATNEIDFLIPEKKMRKIPSTSRKTKVL